jgi:hypothetical protein
MKPITSLIKCTHCRGRGNYVDNFLYQCSLEPSEFGDEPCTTQDYLICPLKGLDDKDVRLGKRKE